MKLQGLPKLKRNPQILDRKAGHDLGSAMRTERQVDSVFISVANALSELDHGDFDLNPRDGEVMVVDHQLGPDLEKGSFSSAFLAYDKESGEVEAFEVVKDSKNSVAYEHKKNFSNPRFTSTVDGVRTRFTMGFEDGLLVGVHSS